MTRVIIESPYKGADWSDTERNIRYVRAAIRDSLLRGEAPYASHALYTLEGILDDKDPNQRALGIGAGFKWRGAAEKTVVYLDLGMSEGMKAGIEHAKSIGHVIEERVLGANWDARG